MQPGTQIANTALPEPVRPASLEPQTLSHPARKAPSGSQHDTKKSPVPELESANKGSAVAARRAQSSQGRPQYVRRGGGGGRMIARCPLCLKTPFHLRYQCPIVTSGTEFIQDKIDELRRDGGNNALVRDLQTLLDRAEQKTSRASSFARSEGDRSTPAPSAGEAPSPRAMSPEVPFLGNLPAGSTISEVIVEAKDDGSSSESPSDAESNADDDEDGSEEDKDDESDGDDDEVQGALSSLTPGFPIAPVLGEVDLESLIRGPVASRSVLDLILSDTSSEPDEDEDDEKLASEEEEKEDKRYRRVAKRFERDAPSSDEEPEPEEPAPKPVDVAGEVAMDVDANIETPVSMFIFAASSCILKTRQASDRPSADASFSVAANSASTSPDQSEYMTPASGGTKTPMNEVIPSSDPAEATRNAEAESSGPSPSVPANEVAMEEPSSPAAPPGEALVVTLQNVPTDGSEHEGGENRQSSEATIVPVPSSPSLSSSKAQHAANTHDDIPDEIEPAEDQVEDEDPIEPFPTQPDRATTPPPRTTQTPGTAKKMKDRFGKIRREDELPVLASHALRARGRSTSEQSSASASNDEQPDPEPPVSPAPEPDAAQKVAATLSSQPLAPPASASAAAAKRRGRPPLSLEEKARRAAEKEKLQADKKALREEKSRQKAAEKVAKGRKSLPADAFPSTPIARLKTPQDAPATPASAPARFGQEPPGSAVKWAILTPTSGDAEASMVDELRSSSSPPDTGAASEGPGDTEPATSLAAPDKSRSSRPFAQNNLVTPMNKTGGLKSSTPLFPATASHLGSYQPRGRVLANAIVSSTRSSVVGQSQGDGAVQKPLRPISSFAPAPSPFLALSVIHRERLVSSHLTPNPGVNRAAAHVFLLDREESSESDSDSEPEASESHFPPDRRAGVQK